VTGLNRQFEPTDVSALFSRYGVVEILELDITHAQGNLFGKPKSSTEVIKASEEGPRLRMVS
jgi:hypothetical protein